MKLLIFLLLPCMFSGVLAGFFSFGLGARNDMDVFIRESDNSRCQWYNSGILSWIPQRINSTTYCRCRDIRLYECKTYIMRNGTNTTAETTTTTTISPSSVNQTTSTTTVVSTTSSTTTSTTPKK